MGYSQVRKVSKNDAKNNVATMQVTKGMESSENVQSKPNKTRSDGELDFTTYDWQTNWGNINRTIVWPDGKVSLPTIWLRIKAIATVVQALAHTIPTPTNGFHWAAASRMKRPVSVPSPAIRKTASLLLLKPIQCVVYTLWRTRTT